MNIKSNDRLRVDLHYNLLEHKFYNRLIYRNYRISVQQLYKLKQYISFHARRKGTVSIDALNRVEQSKRNIEKLTKSLLRTLEVDGS